MKGQLSLEYMVLALAALAMLSASVLTLSAVKRSAEGASGSLRFESDATALSNAMGEVCALGGGNGREVRLSAPLRLEARSTGQGWAVRLSSGDGSIVRESLCLVPEGEVSGKVYVKNEKGEVVFRGR